MSDREKYGTRDLLYSGWHRTDRIKRFIGDKTASAMKMIDIDACEYDEKTMTPLVLVELALDTGQTRKDYYVTRNLAIMAGIPALLVLYKPNATHDDIESFRVKRLTPNVDDEWMEMSPVEYAQKMVRLRAWALARLKGMAS